MRTRRCEPDDASPSSMRNGFAAWRNDPGGVHGGASAPQGSSRPSSARTWSRRRWNGSFPFRGAVPRMGSAVGRGRDFLHARHRSGGWKSLVGRLATPGGRSGAERAFGLSSQERSGFYSAKPRSLRNDLSAGSEQYRKFTAWNRNGITAREDPYSFHRKSLAWCFALPKRKLPMSIYTRRPLVAARRQLKSGS